MSGHGVNGVKPQVLLYSFTYLWVRAESDPNYSTYKVVEGPENRWFSGF